jgi:hypothetical protein
MIAPGYMMNDGAPVQRDNLVVTAHKDFVFSLRLISSLNIPIDEAPCPHKHEIVFEGGLSEVPGIGTIFALFNHLPSCIQHWWALTSISRHQDGLGQQKSSRS